jgi:protein-disulfide isomerase
MGAIIESVPPVTGEDHVVGAPDAPVTLIVYGNYECLHCRRMYPAVEALRSDFGGQLRIAHRHFARAADFPHAELAAEAAESAAAQGRFWDMHAALSQHAQFLDEPALLAEAERIGLDLDAVIDDLESRRYHALVRRQSMAAADHGVASTPTFFINGNFFPATYDLGALTAAVGAAVRVAR